MLDPEPARFEPPEDNTVASSFENYAPHILVYSSGDMTAFEVGQRVEEYVESNLLGDIKFVEDDPL